MKCRLLRVLQWVGPVALLVAPCAIAVSEDAAAPTPEQLEFFEKRVRPVLAENCFKCHGPAKQRGGLRLDSRAAILKGGDTGPAIVPGQPDASELIAAVNYDADGYQMPPSGKLAAEEIAALTAWVKLGAPWPAAPNGGGDSTAKNAEFDLQARAKHWSFQPLQPQSPPIVNDAEWPQSPVDRFILAKLEAAGLRPALPAEKRALLRRVTFDVIGLPPTPEEIDAFLADDSPDAFSQVVDRLLASPHYGERWGRHWLDLVRFAETAGHEFDYEIQHAWSYRDYVIRALNADVPYDRFVIEHVAGDLLTDPRPGPAGRNESILGTAFYWFPQGKHSPVDIRAEQCDRFDNQLDVFGKTFLGLTVACARCHDHKFDPITTRDYYALAGYLQSTHQQFAYLYNDEAAAPEAWAQHTAEYAQASERVLEDVIERGRGQLSELLTRRHADVAAVAGGELGHPWHVWAVLGGSASPQEFVTQRDALRQRMQAERDKAAETVEFTAQADTQWFRTGRAFSLQPHAIGSLRMESEGETPRATVVPADRIHSGRIAPQLQGELRSSSFVIEKQFIHYRVRRSGGRPNPGVKHKNGQIHLIVDGFHLIQNPLWGHLTINTHNDGHFRWYRQDLNKLIGHRAHIEIADDEPDGWIEVDRIVFSDAPQPPNAVNPVMLELLSDVEVASREALLNRLAEQVQESSARWHSGRLHESPNAAAQARLLSAVGELALPAEASEIAPLTRAHRRLLDDARQPALRVLAAADGSGEDEYLLVRGNHNKPGDLVPRRFLEVFAGSEGAQPQRGSGRLELARAMTAPGNPLIHRVLVNRLWQHHFGRGIVPTPDNFGVLGQEPSHPELLDFLAAEFVRRGWSLKSMHRLMLLSSTYQMSSRPDDSRAESIDPENILLHRMPIRRLEGEVIRDAVLALSGQLDERMYGPSVLPFLTPFMEGRGRPRSGPLDGDGRRSIYINVRRNFLTPMFLAFDYPTPLSTMGRRSVSNVPAQALTMMNNPFIVQQSQQWAARVLADDRDTPAERVTRLYEMAFARPPGDDEIAAALDFLDVQGQEYAGPHDPRTWADLCHVLWNVKEFVFVR